MTISPTLIFVPGSWHKPTCYNKVIKSLEEQHKIKCVAVALPSTQDNPKASFKDDIDAVRDAITSEAGQGRDTIVISHSYGGMVGNSAIKGLTRPVPSNNTSTKQTPMSSDGQDARTGHVIALVLIASGFTITGFAFLDPFFGHPPPFFRFDKETGYAVLLVNPRQFFYHDVPEEEAEYWVKQLTTQSFKALSQGGEHAYAGWGDVPTWYIGTVEDQGLPVAMQRMQVGAVRALGATVHHRELQSSHSPFLSMPDAVVDVLMDTVQSVGRPPGEAMSSELSNTKKSGDVISVPAARLNSPMTWFRYGIPLLFGRAIGWSISAFLGLRRLWSRK